MSDEKLADISEDDVRNFMDAKKVRIACELCEATAWLIYRGMEVSHLPSVMVLCGNCGNARWHSRAVVTRWKEKGY